MNITQKLVAIGIAAMASIASVPAIAAPYLINYTIGSGKVTGTITTDGTIGALSTGNISAFDLLLNDGVTSFEISNNNAQVLIEGSDLSANSSGLSYNFGGNGFALFQAPAIGSSKQFFCLESGGCTGQGVGATVDVNSPFPGQHIAQSGVLKVGTITGAVPEPASWAMMILGMGAVGFAMRSAKRRSDEKFDAKIKRITYGAAA